LNNTQNESTATKVHEEAADAAASEKRHHEDRDIRTLKDFIDYEYQTIQLYKKLAMCCTGFNRQELMRISADEKMHMCKLQTELFLISGDTHCPTPVCTRIDGVMRALSMAYRHELEAEEAYLDAAKETRRSELARLYRCIAEDECRHAKTIRGIIERAMCR
jgi:Uncharacterized conserved protein